MLKKRVITTLWGVPLLVAAVWFDEPLPWLTIFVAILGSLAIFEFYRMVTSAQVSPLAYFGLIWTLLFIVSPHFDYAILIPLLFSSAVVLPLIWLILRRKKEGVFTSWAWTIAGILYVGWLLSYLVALRDLGTPAMPDAGKDWIFFALFTTFASDTSAFFTGKFLGRHKLAPRISPGKTWEGAIGGVTGAAIVSLLLVAILELPLSHGQAILLGLAVSILGQLGDLTESLLKRKMGVKDSGKILPGHGGVLDRIDSVVFTGILLYYYVVWVIM